MPVSADYLISTQHTSGGWGYLEASDPAVEPTAVALLAIHDQPGSESAFQKALAWMVDNQNEDGGWGVTQEDPESGWQTAWALIALDVSSSNGDPILRGGTVDPCGNPTRSLKKDFRKFQIPASDDPGALVWPWMQGRHVN
jgi:squalene cyclase